MDYRQDHLQQNNKEFMDDEPSELLEEQLIDDNEVEENEENIPATPNFSLTD